MKSYVPIFAFFLCTFLTIAQEIEGVVVSDTGDPLPGVNVVEKGTQNGVVTDFDGNFIITAAPESTLVFSYVGFETQERVAGSSPLRITLKSGLALSEVFLVGSRNAKRSSTDTAVPVDVIDAQGVAAISGKVEVNDILQYAAPSFNATKQSGSDGADHIVPASLRGLGPDQTLVLINGKRRHQSSLVNVFGTRGRGNSGTDLNAIPSSAIKRIEVLRDGASAQYGSDAIAGVINIVLKDNTDGLTGGLTYGAYSTNVGEGWAEESGETLYNVQGENRLDGKNKNYDGETVKVDLNYGLKLTEKGGYANFTTEFLSRNNTLRPGFSWRKGYGSAGISGFNFMINASLPLSDDTELYLFGGKNYRDTNAYAFSRDSFADGDNRSVPSLYPKGFTPRITSVISDNSFSAGIRHTMKNGWRFDFNNSYGKNNFHYYILDTNNASLKDASPTDFDAGGHYLSQNTTSIDFSKYFEESAAGINLAFGLEYRTENFGIFSGEAASYGFYDDAGLIITNRALQTVATDTNGDSLPGGSQGFPGYSPSNEVDRNRSNFGVYIDTEINATENFLVSGALRYEKYSDFGNTLNFKIASRLKANEKLSFRGSVSTGFRAPSLVQLYYNLVFNNIVAGKSVPSLLSANNSTITKAFGIQQLKEEKAFNGSVGFTYNSGPFKVTLDAYSITVTDRIILTDNFKDQNVLGPLGVDAAQFFANGVNTQTQGIDVVLNYDFRFNDDKLLKILAVGNFNDLKIKKINNGSLNEYTFFSPFSRAYLEAAAPDHKLGLGLNYIASKFNASLSLTRFSEVQLQDYQWVDDPPLTKAGADVLYEKATDVYEARTVFDASLGYDLSKHLTLQIGANNLFNVYPTPQFDGWTDQGGFSDSVQMGSDGRYVFTRLNFKF